MSSLSPAIPVVGEARAKASKQDRRVVVFDMQDSRTIEADGLALYGARRPGSLQPVGRSR